MAFAWSYVIRETVRRRSKCQIQVTEFIPGKNHSETVESERKLSSKPLCTDQAICAIKSTSDITLEVTNSYMHMKNLHGCKF